jgi:multicomponent Na+:H+ antiporter subunit F
MQNVIEIASQVTMGILCIALALAAWRLIKGPTLPDRVVALDLIGVTSLGMVAVATIRSNNPVYLDVGFVFGLIVVMGTVAFARYLERRIGA